MSNSKKIREIEKRIRRIVDDTITRSVSSSLGEMLKDRVIRRVTLGYGIDKSKNQRTFKPLSSEYIKQRQRYRRNLADSTTPRKSNVTATGQMLDAVRVVPFVGKIILEIAGRRRRTLSGGVPKGDAADNAKVARYVQDAGREFFGATKAEREFIAREIRKIVLKKLKR